MSTAATCDRVARALALETSGRVGSVAAFHSQGDQATVLAASTLPADQRSAQSLLPTISALLQTLDWRADELDFVCTSTGPGSFTGLRLGVTVAKTLAYATGAQLVGVNTLAALAVALGDVSQPVWSILDAQRQELFAAHFPPGWLHEADFPIQTSILTGDDWLGGLRAGDLVIGPPLEKLMNRLPDGVAMADSMLWQPAAEAVARLGLRDLRRGLVIDPVQLVPHYFRLSAAEEKAQAQN
jgi:tRNA threonylcarbamoyladenosine biosynthesis protein TsaB